MQSVGYISLPTKPNAHRGRIQGSISCIAFPDSKRWVHRDPGDGVPVTFETSDGTAIQWSIRLGGVLGMEQLFARVEKAAAQAGFDPIGHLSVQYTDRATGMVEQAWHDRVLGEGTDVEIVKSATQLRVLLLGGVHRGAAPPPAAVPRVARRRPRLGGCALA